MNNNAVPCSSECVQSFELSSFLIFFFSFYFFSVPADGKNRDMWGKKVAQTRDEDKIIMTSWAGHKNPVEITILYPSLMTMELSLFNIHSHVPNHLV